MLIPEGASTPAAEGFFIPPIGGGGNSVTLGGGGGAGSGAFDIEGGKVVRCGLLFGRRWLECEDKELRVLRGGQAPAGAIYATVSHPGTEDPELSVNAGRELPENSLDASHRLLYRARGTGADASWDDFRNAVTIMSMD